MKPVRILVIRAAGINCDEEVMHCWQLVGANPSLVHINELANNPSILDDFQIVTIPGGFSYGDDIAAGTILAQSIASALEAPMKALIDRGGGILGICNGFQVLVKTGLLPGGDVESGQVTVTFNESAKFEARWVRMEVATTRCAFLTPDLTQESASSKRNFRLTKPVYLEMPVEHAEGRVVTASEQSAESLSEKGLVALRYVDMENRHDTYPANPNGSWAGIAGLCDETGRVLGLMPHPDRNFAPTHHPQWTGRKQGTPDGLQVFLNAMSYWGR